MEPTLQYFFNAFGLHQLFLYKITVLSIALRFYK